MEKYLLKNCDIANFDTLCCNRNDIYIADGKIIKIAPSINRPESNIPIIDLKGKMVLPAFIDSHTHLLQTFLKGYLDDYPITDWLVRMFHAESLFTEEDCYYSVLVGALEALRFGTTTINDMGMNTYFDAGVQAIKDSGIRAIIGMGLTDISESTNTPVRSTDENLVLAKKVYDTYQGYNHGRITTCVAPLGLPSCSAELMKQLKSFATERNLIFHTHLAEGKKETLDVLKRTGYMEAEALYHLGILDEHTVLAHSIWLDEHELDLIKKTNANPVHCPSTNMKLSDGIPKIQSMLERGINVCMGCDGEASSSNRDLIREARAGSYLQKGSTLNPKAMDVGTTYRMMTQNGAKALGFSNLGCVKEGYLADLIVVDMEHDLSLTNRQTRISNLLYAGSGQVIDSVFINGTLIIKEKKNCFINEQKILEKSEELLYKFDKKLNSI
ncbi:MAG: amidohydrolase family protein [Velocimicrobium sp.]